MNKKLQYKIAAKNRIENYVFKKAKLQKVGMITLWEHNLTKELSYSILPPDDTSNVWIPLKQYPQYKNL